VSVKLGKLITSVLLVRKNGVELFVVNTQTACCLVKGIHLASDKLQTIRDWPSRTTLVEF
jgi:hypothetical protein